MTAITDSYYTFQIRNMTNKIKIFDSYFDSEMKKSQFYNDFIKCINKIVDLYNKIYYLKQFHYVGTSYTNIYSYQDDKIELFAILFLENEFDRLSSVIYDINNITNKTIIKCFPPSRHDLKKLSIIETDIYYKFCLIKYSVYEFEIEINRYNIKQITEYEYNKQILSDLWIRCK